jgi:hypothetical protein
MRAARTTFIRQNGSWRLRSRVVSELHSFVDGLDFSLDNLGIQPTALGRG